MTAEQCRNKSSRFWELTDEQVKAYEKVEYNIYRTRLNAAEWLTGIINKEIYCTCEIGKTSVSVNLSNESSVPDSIIRKMTPYLQWYYRKDGFGFTMDDCIVTVDWSNQ